MNASAGTVQLAPAAALTGGEWNENYTTYTVAYSNLAYNRQYTVVVSGFKDLADNVMVENSSHNFTTVGRSIAGATVTVSGEYTYNGSAHTPASDNVSVQLGVETLDYSDDYARVKP
jgi:hypothetical protein